MRLDDAIATLQNCGLTIETPQGYAVLVENVDKAHMQLRYARTAETMAFEMPEGVVRRNAYLSLLHYFGAQHILHAGQTLYTDADGLAALIILRGAVPTIAGVEVERGESWRPSPEANNARLVAIMEAVGPAFWKRARGKEVEVPCPVWFRAVVSILQGRVNSDLYGLKLVEGPEFEY